MSELIDRKELLKCFCITKDGRRIPEVDCDNHEITISIKDIKRIIREQPTVDTRTPMSNIVEKLEEKTEFLKDYTKYGNESAEQQEKSYSTMMMYEVADLVDDLIDIVKQGINNGLE